LAYLYLYFATTYAVIVSTGTDLFFLHNFFYQKMCIYSYIRIAMFVTVNLWYTGCFTTLGHNCRRWFPRSLW